jgi:hypothetical protein
MLKISQTHTYTIDRWMNDVNMVGRHFMEIHHELYKQCALSVPGGIGIEFASLLCGLALKKILILVHVTVV